MILECTSECGCLKRWCMDRSRVPSNLSYFPCMSAPDWLHHLEGCRKGHRSSLINVSWLPSVLLEQIGSRTNTLFPSILLCDTWLFGTSFNIGSVFTASWIQSLALYKLPYLTSSHSHPQLRRLESKLSHPHSSKTLRNRASIVLDIFLRTIVLDILNQQTQSYTNI